MTEAEWLASDDPVAMLRHLRYSVYEEPTFGGETMESRHPSLISDRKLRLFACACCRVCWHLLTDERSRRAVEVAERFADGAATEQERQEAWDNALRCHQSDAANRMTLSAADCANGNGQIAAACNWMMGSAFPLLPDHKKLWAIGAALLRDIVGNPFRPVMLPLLMPHGASSAECPWLTPTVRSLAQACYEERPGRVCGRCLSLLHLVAIDTSKAERAAESMRKCPDCHGTGRIEDGTLCPNRLAVLADALEDAGCTEEVILRWLRGEEPVLREMPRQTQTVGPTLHRLVGWRPRQTASYRGDFVIDLILGKE